MFVREKRRAKAAMVRRLNAQFGGDAIACLQSSASKSAFRGGIGTNPTLPS
jgi:hypothetical protein